MKSPEYWQKRAEESLLTAERKGNSLVKELNAFYAETTRIIERDVEAFYGRYAKNNAITIQDAKMRIPKPQLNSFREEMANYYAEAERVGLGKEYKDYLRRLSARGYISRQEELLAQINHQVNLLANRELEAFMGGLSDAYKESYYHSIFDIQKGLGFGGNFNVIDNKAIESIIKKPWLGSNFSDRIWNNKEQLFEKLNRIIPQAFATGQNSRVLAARLAHEMGVEKWKAERLVRTEINHAANQATLAGYKEAGIEEYKYLATLDTRTSEWCQNLDNKVFRIVDAQAGINYPPLHPFCRSTTVAYFPPDEFDTPSVRAARDSEGKYYTVPADMSYKKWYDKYVNRALTDAEESAIASIVSSISFVINRKLRDGEKLSSMEQTITNNLDSALNKLPVYEGEVKRTLVASFDEMYELALSARSGEMNFSAFSSASILDDYHTKPNVVMKIISHNGKDLRKHNASEQEILFVRNSKFKVSDTRLEKGVLFIDMEEIDE